MAIAALASMATSAPYWAKTRWLRGDSIALSSAASTARVLFTLRNSAGPHHVSLHIEAMVRVLAGEALVEVGLENASGQIIFRELHTLADAESVALSPERMSFACQRAPGEECVDEMVLTYSLVGAATEEVAVDWTVTAQASGDEDEPPDGLVLELASAGARSVSSAPELPTQETFSDPSDDERWRLHAIFDDGARRNLRAAAPLRFVIRGGGDFVSSELRVLVDLSHRGQGQGAQVLVHADDPAIGVLGAYQLDSIGAGVAYVMLPIPEPLDCAPTGDVCERGFTIELLPADDNSGSVSANVSVRALIDGGPGSGDRAPDDALLELTLDQMDEIDAP